MFVFFCSVHLIPHFLELVAYRSNRCEQREKVSQAIAKNNPELFGTSNHSEPTLNLPDSIRALLKVQRKSAFQLP